MHESESESEVSQSCPTLATPWTAAYQAPLSMGLSRQKYWSGVSLPSPFAYYLSEIPFFQCEIQNCIQQRDGTGREEGGGFRQCRKPGFDPWVMKVP